MKSATIDKTSKAITWEDQLSEYRKTKKPFSNLFSVWKSDLSLRIKFKKTYLNCALSYNYLKVIRDEVRTYGRVISDNYSKSLIKQFIQQVYLQFVLGVSPKNYRVYLLFKDERWKQVKEFAYDNVEPEKKFIEMRFPKGETYDSSKDIFKDKNAFYEYCISNQIPTPTVLKTIKLSNRDSQQKNAISLPKEDIFIKPLEGARGMGATKFFYQNNKYLDNDGKEYTTSNLLHFLGKQPHNSNHDRREFIVQPVLKNHEDWEPFTSGALATCRILCGKEPGTKNIEPIAAALRMPTGSMIADNFSKGGIASPINIQSGELGSAISFEPRNNSYEFTTHPDTGHKLSGIQLPEWRNLLSFIKGIHQKFKFTFVAWDISYTTQGFTVIEGNGLWDIDILESPHNRPISETIYPALYNKWINKSLASDT